MARSDLYKAVAGFAKPRTRTAIGQALETLLPYFALWALMIVAVRAGLAYGITLALAVITAGFHVRVSSCFRIAATDRS